jgi:hypothetical protein
MSLEKAVADLTVALQENTAALKAAGGKPAAGTKPAAAPAAKKVSEEEMKGALSALKAKHGADAAKAVIKSAGGVEKLAEITEDKYAAVYDAAKKATEADKPAAEDDGL